MKSLRHISTAVVTMCLVLGTQVFPQSGLTAFYPFYSSLMDESGHGLTPDSSAITYVPDRFGNSAYAAAFDGTSSFMAISDTGLLDISGQITIEAWVLLDSMAPARRHYLLVKPEAEGVEPPSACYGLMTNESATAWEFRVGAYVFEFGDVEPGIWQHLAVTFNHALQRANCYQDNELVSTTPALLNDIPTSDQPLVIGANREHVEVFQGIIDDIRIFDVALDSARIDSLYRLPFGPNFQLSPTGVINFGDVYVGYPDTLTLRITNYGLGLIDLFILNVEIADTQFTTDLAPLDIPSGESVEFGVSFNPVIYNNSSTTMTIASNDTDDSPHFITLTGRAIPPPVPVFTPLSFSDTLYSGAESSFELSIQNLSSFGPLQYRSRLLDSLGDSTVFFQKLSWTDWQDPENQDRITPNMWITRDNSGGIFNARYEPEFNSIYSPRLTEWAEGHHPRPNDQYHDWGFTYGSNPYVLLTMVVNAYLEWDDVYLDFWFQSWMDEGAGGGFSYIREIAPQPWIEYEPISGFLWSGHTINQSITFRAGQLPPGSYQANIGFWINDPQIPFVLIPLSLVVLEGPNFSISRDTVDFFYGFIGHPDTVRFDVENSGLGVLQISDITLPGRDMSITPTSVSLDPDSSQQFQIIFDPTDIGDQSGDLAFTTNDPDESIVHIPVFAVGSYPPVVYTNTDSIFLIMGTSSGVDTVFQITNIGDSDLRVHFLPMAVVGENIAYNTNPSMSDFETFWGPVYNDPPDPPDYLDLRSVVFGVTEDAVLIRIITTQEIQHPDRGLHLFFDTDRNPDTGTSHPTWGIGSDYELRIYGPSLRIYQDGGYPGGITPPSSMWWNYKSQSNELMLSVPYDLFGDSLAWRVGIYTTTDHFTYDVLPDQGSSLVPVPADWIRVTPEYAEIPVGESLIFHVEVDQDESPFELREAALHIMSNDPLNQDKVLILSTTTVGIKHMPQIPDMFTVANSPNPFNGSTIIKYGLTQNSRVELTIYDLRGRPVLTLVNPEEVAGWHEIVWNGMDQEGHSLSSGVYLLRLTVHDFSKTMRILMLK